MRRDASSRRCSTDLASRVLYEDNHIIAINKLPSEIVQGDETGDPTLLDDVKGLLKERDRKPGNVYLGVPHRLDRPTSGVVIFAKTEKALSRLSVMFRDRKVDKIYWAIVDRQPPETEGRLVHHLVRDASKNKSFAYDAERKRSKVAELSYHLICATKSFYLLEIELHTGRHHQIRAQLAAVGVHIKGDLKYGSARSNRDGGIHLHARKVSFIHPVSGEPVVVIAAPPNDQIWNSVAGGVADRE